MEPNDQHVAVRRELAVISPALPVDELEADTELTPFGVDSADLAELVARLEDETGVLIGDDELVDVRSVADLGAVIDRLQGRRGR
jgi:acyl carrier protein